MRRGDEARRRPGNGCAGEHRDRRGAGLCRRPDAGLGAGDRRRAQQHRLVFQPRLRGSGRPDRRQRVRAGVFPPRKPDRAPDRRARGVPCRQWEHRIRRHPKRRVRVPGGREARRRRRTGLGTRSLRCVPLQRIVDQLRLPTGPGESRGRRRRRGRGRRRPRRSPRSSASRADTPRSASGTRGSASRSSSAARSRSGPGWIRTSV